MIQNTIRDLFARGDIDGIIYQVEILIADRERVRNENLGFKHQIHLLAQALARITEPATGRPIAETKPKPAQSQITERPPPPARTPKSKSPLDLDL